MLQTMTRTLTVAAALTLAAGTVSAQEGVGPEAGSWELLLSGTGASDSDFDAGSFGFTADVGYYFNPALAVGGRQTLSFADTGESSWNGATSAFVDYHFFTDRRVRPFIGASLGYLYGDDTEETFIAGPEVGVKWYVKDETFIYGRAAYEFLFDDPDDADDAIDDGRFVYTLGVGFNF